MNPLEKLTLSMASGPLPPQASGIYVLSLAGEVVYVGSSRNILARIGQHATARLGFDQAHWLELKIGTALRYEGALIRALHPTLAPRAPAAVSSDRDILVTLGLPPHEDEAAVFAAARRRNGQAQREAYWRGVTIRRDGRAVTIRTRPEAA